MITDLLIDIEDLKVSLYLDSGTANVVDGINLRIKGGDTLALVGESGCGKTMTAYSIMRLLPEPPAKITGGKILFEGEDLLTASEKRMREIRGNRIAMIFQEPLTSLNPVFKVGAQIAEVIQIHRKIKKKDALEIAVDLLRDVGIPSPAQRLNDYPHQMSGGMRQRVMIAMALACEPDLVIADEPTTALDVTVQSQIMALLKGLIRKHNMSLLLITHDLGVVAETADQVAVMYAGRIMEYAEVKTLFNSPENPYTVGLLESLPHFGKERLKPIKGMVPSINELPQGCKFSTRCGHVFDKCAAEEPPLFRSSVNCGEAHLVRCWKAERTKQPGTET